MKLQQNYNSTENFTWICVSFYVRVVSVTGDQNGDHETIQLPHGAAGQVIYQPQSVDALFGVPFSYYSFII